jgi:hypothetical protein
MKCLMSSTSPSPIDHPSTQNSVLCLTVALCCYLIVYYFLGEHAHYNGGLGFDGHFYGTLAQDVPGVLAKRIPDYYLDRILPSIIISLSAKALGFSLAGTDQVVNAFHVYDSALLVAASLAWVRLSRTLKLSSEVAIIGWACLFLNWTVLKQYLYFPVQTDATALALGVCVALCAIERRPYLLAVTAFIASFAWKTVMPLTLLLILFPYPISAQTPVKVPTRLQTVVPIAGAVIAAAAAIYVTVILQHRLGAGAAQVDPTTLPLSVAILALYVYYVARSAPLARIVAPLRIEGLGAIVFFASLWGLRALILSVMSEHFGNGQEIETLSTFVVSLFVLPVAKPALFLMAMIVAFGPGFILLLWHLPRVMSATASHSFGSIVLVIVAMALAMNTESRQLVFFYPLLIAFLCKALQEVGPGRKFAITFVACSLLLSKVYLPLNALGMGAISSTEELDELGDLLRFPWQWFFMNLGVYMSWIAYATNLAMIIGVVIVLFSVRPHGASSATR